MKQTALTGVLFAIVCSLLAALGDAEEGAPSGLPGERDEGVPMDSSPPSATPSSTVPLPGRG